MNKNFLVTGGAGYIGTSLTKRLLDEGAKVTIFDNLKYGNRDLVDTRAVFIMGDVCDSEALDKVFTSNTFDTVIHLAALKSVEESEKNPAEFIHVNVTGTINILEIMKKKQISSLVFSSTAAVYKENEAGIYDEDSTLSPQSIYGSSKVICEELISQYERLGHINQAIIFRYFNLAGDTGLRFFDLNAQNVFPIIARAYLEDRVFSIFGDNFDTPDGTGIRDYIHLSDLVEAHVLSLRGNIKGVFNLGTQQGTSVKKLTEIFNSYLERPLKVKFADRRTGDVAKAIANSKKAEIKFGWVANASLEDMVRSTIETFNVR